MPVWDLRCFFAHFLICMQMFEWTIASWTHFRSFDEWVADEWSQMLGMLAIFSHVFIFPSHCFKCYNCATQFLHFSRDRLICRYLFLNCYFGFCWTVLQENNKTKHPQLLYEAKLYHILQGGSMLLDVRNAFAYTWLAFMHIHVLCEWFTSVLLRLHFSLSGNKSPH